MAILFLGDSFTFGEGLEFYCDTPKWISERKKYNDWSTLQQKQDSDSIEFRNTNRFSSLVADHFGTQAIQNNKNGGGFQDIVLFAEECLFNPEYSIDTIILQLTTAQRGSLHDLSRFRTSDMCDCFDCLTTDHSHIYQELTSGNVNHNIIEFFERRLDCKIDDHNFMRLFESDRLNFFKTKVDQLYDNHIYFWLSEGRRKVYIIDSWCNETSKFINDGPLEEMKIKLISPSENLYSNWKFWSHTFEFNDIAHQFPATKNHHPTLIQHEFLAKSIIKKLEENYD